MKKTILTFIALAFSIGVWAQERATHEIHAAMLYNFIKYVQWPNEGEGGEFVVGVLGEDDVFNTLKTWYDGKPKGSKKYVIKKLGAAEQRVKTLQQHERQEALKARMANDHGTFHHGALLASNLGSTAFRS